jgi:hypothetical protein
MHSVKMCVCVCVCVWMGGMGGERGVCSACYGHHKSIACANNTPCTCRPRLPYNHPLAFGTWGQMHGRIVPDITALQRPGDKRGGDSIPSSEDGSKRVCRASHPAWHLPTRQTRCTVNLTGPDIPVASITLVDPPTLAWHGDMSLRKLLSSCAFHGTDMDRCTHTAFAGRLFPGKFVVPRSDDAASSADYLFTVLSEREYHRHIPSGGASNTPSIRDRHARPMYNILSERGTPWKSLLFDIDLTHADGYVDVRQVQSNGWSVLAVIHQAVKECFPFGIAPDAGNQETDWAEAVVTTACGRVWDRTWTFLRCKTSYTVTFRQLRMEMKYHEPVRRHVVRTLRRLFGNTVCGKDWDTDVVDPTVMRARHSNRSLWHDKIAKKLSETCVWHGRTRKKKKEKKLAPAGGTRTRCSCELVVHNRPCIPFAAMAQDGSLLSHMSHRRFTLSTVASTSALREGQPQIVPVIPSSGPIGHLRCWPRPVLHSSPTGAGTVGIPGFNWDPSVTAPVLSAMMDGCAENDGGSGRPTTVTPWVGEPTVELSSSGDIALAVLHLLYSHLCTDPTTRYIDDSHEFQLRKLWRRGDRGLHLEFRTRACRCLVAERRRNVLHVHNSQSTFVNLRISAAWSQAWASVYDYHCCSELGKDAEGRSLALESIDLSDTDLAPLMASMNQP